MARIPVKFRRIVAAFNEGAKIRLCESSGSDHSPDNSTDLSDLVNSFIERQNTTEEDEDHTESSDRKSEVSESDTNYLETRERLQSLLACDEEVIQRIRAETQLACQYVGNSSSSKGHYKRQLMSRLRNRGFDAGLCKSRWEKSGGKQAGEYEYIDVNDGETRYIVEVFLAGEFEIARPTDQYVSFLQLLPPIFVCKPDELKQIVRLISTAMKQSMKSMDMHVPPWRRNAYMQAKWFSSYKRTINAVSAKKVSDSGMGFPGKQLIGFEYSSEKVMPVM